VARHRDTAPPRAALSLPDAEALSAASLDPALLLDGRGRIVAANAAARDLLGPVGGRPLGALLQRDAGFRRLAKARRVGRPFRGRLVLRHGARVTVGYGPVGPGGYLTLRPETGGVPALADDPLVRYGPLLERLPLAWALLDRERRVRALDARMVAILGASFEGSLGRSFDAASAGLPAAEMEAFDRRALAGERLGCVDHVQDLGGGRKRILRTHRIPLGSPPEALLLAIEDVTERLGTADGIAVDGDLVQTILDYMPGFISLKDAATRRFLFATGTDRVILDQPAHYLIGRSAADLYEPELAAAIDEAESRLLETPGATVDRRFPRQLGPETRWFFSRKLAVPDREGRPRYILTFNLDITHEIEIEQALARANRFLDALFDTMPAMLAVREIATGRLVRVNPSFCRFLGRAPEAILGAPVDALGLGDPAVRRADEARLVAGESAVADRIEPVDVAAGKRWLRTLEVVVHGDAGRPSHVLALHYDVTERIVAERRLAQSRAFLDTIVQHVPWPLAVTDAASGEVLLTNAAGRDGLLGKLAAPSGDRLGAVLAALDARVKAAPDRAIDELVAEGEGERRRWHRVRKVAVPDGSEACRYLLTLAEDVTERHRMTARLQRSEALLRRSQSIARVGSWRWCAGSPVLEGSEELHRLLGRPVRAGPLPLREVLRAVPSGDRARLRSILRLVREADGRASVEIRLRRLDGALRHLSVEAELDRSEEVGPLAVLGTAQDVTERVEAESRMRHLALHDYLTGLPNRLLFDERLAAAVSAADARGRMVALHCIDLNDFKGLNDTLGHQAGDDLLRQVAERLVGLVDAGDLVARLGGDEFAILQHEVDGPERAATLASRVTAALAAPFHVAGKEVFSTASVGIALSTGKGLGPGDLLRQADIALYAAKAAGRGTFRFFSPELNARLRERKLIEARLRLALENRTLELAYQPQYALRTGRMVGVEALLRWRDAELGQVPPDRFIAVAEDTSQILELGEFVLHEACAQAARWRAAGLPIGRIAVNLSPAQFAYQDLVDTVQRALKATGLPPEALELEITEGTLMRDRQGAVATLQALHALGVTTALDDFGTGYSSLAYLKRFPLDKIKIDRSFVSDLPDDPDDAAIARTIISLGKTLGLKVLAEGVETPAQRDFLLREGCDEAQGYFFAKPLTAAQLEAMLEEDRVALGA
jgi:diguanylate cyclase (GGDEF)-like protein/PAS domain S-box-containing protein